MVTDNNSNFQRKGAKSNAHVGREFEEQVRKVLEKTYGQLSRGFSIDIGVANRKKAHKFDLGSDTSKVKVLVECKSHTWTEGNKVPSAKLTTWNQEMYYFHLAPKKYKKVFCVLKDRRPRNRETLAEYYIRTRQHLIPKGVEFWEFPADEGNPQCVWPENN